MRNRQKKPKQKSGPAPSGRVPRTRWLIPVVLLAIGVVLWRVRTGPDGGPAPEEKQVPDNLLLITVDTTRADYLGCYGRTEAATPNMDRLAAEGTRFARCTACTPQTLPSHCTIMTGCYPFVHGIRNNAIVRLSDAEVTVAETLREAGFATQAIVASVVLNRSHGLDQGFEEYLDVHAETAGNPAAAERKADVIGNDAVSALRRLRGGTESGSAGRKRFFLWVHFYDPHHPYESSRFVDQDSTEAYADEVAYMDLHIGRLMSELWACGLDRNTLVVLVGDHGEGLGQHGESEHGYLLQETTTHVPLIIREPGMVPAQQVCTAQVRTVDLVPTVLDYLGLPATPRLQGVSLRPLIDRATQDLGLEAYSETFLPREVLALGPLRALTRGGWKYIHSGRPELYDLAADPGETRDLLAQQPDLASRMKEGLRALLAEAPPRLDAKPTPATLPPSEIQKLEALGYVGSTGEEKPASTELALFESQGKNPADHLPAIENFLKGHRLLALNRHAEAEPWLLSAALAFTESKVLWQELALAYRKAGRAEEILSVCAACLADHPESKQVRICYARQLARAHRVEDSADVLAAGVKIVPQDGEMHKELGDALTALQRYDEGREAYQRAIELNPRDTTAYLGYASLCTRQELYDEAVEHLRDALAIEPDSRVVQRELRNAEQKLNSTGKDEP